MPALRSWLLGGLFGLLAALVAASAHEGHDHGAPPPAANTKSAPRAEASSGDFELVVVARGTVLEISLDTFAGNEPVEGATIDIDSASGLLKAEASGGGLYRVAAPALTAPGSHDLAFTITAGDKVDVLATTLLVPSAATATVVPTSVAARSQALWQHSSLSLAGAGILGFVGGLLAAGLWRRRSTRAALGTVAGLFLLLAPSAPPAVAGDAVANASPVSALARDIAQRLGDGSVFVPKPTQRILAIRTVRARAQAHARSVELPGRVVPDQNASGLVQASIGGRLSPPEGGFRPLGTAVKAGDVLAYVKPPLPSADATLQAQQARELDQQLAIVGRRVERYRTLAPSGAVARAQLDDAELELKGLTERRQNLDRVNRAPKPLIAPVAGVIAASNAVAGQMAEPSSVILQIIDPRRLWVEALAFEPQSLTTAATARVADGRELRLAYLGTGLADRNQAIPVQFAIESDTQGLRPGQLVTVYATTSEERHGIALPRTAVLRSANGQAVVYEHSGAERFIPREVRTQSLDGARVLVIAGIEPGRRIVTQGAELLDQIR